MSATATRGRKALNLGDVPSKLHSRLASFAKRRNISMAAAARMLLTEGLDRADKQQEPGQ